MNFDQRGEREVCSVGYSRMLAISNYENNEISLGAFQDISRELAWLIVVRVE